MANIKITSESFAELLLESVSEAKEHASGKVTLKSEALVLPSSPPKYSKTKIKKLRTELNVSQAVFAKILNVSLQTVRAWEQGDNIPKGATVRLFQLIEFNPRQFLEAIK